ncbi:Sedlin [Globomyces pollinis-pini]|nr:Sedlin [Globomyces pollinis-pini]
MSNCYFVIVGTKDNPLYEAEFGPLAKDAKNDNRHLHQFIVHSSLDIVDELLWGTQSKYLKIVDKFNEWNVSAYVLPSGIRFMLLHDTMNTDGIKHFFQECHELYIKVLLNPFMDVNGIVSSGLFDQRVKVHARKWL